MLGLWPRERSLYHAEHMPKLRKKLVAAKPGGKQLIGLQADDKRH